MYSILGNVCTKKSESLVLTIDTISTADVTEVAAEDIQHDQEYVVPVLVGTPGVVLHLDLDTGSSDLWVWSSELRIDTQRHVSTTSIPFTVLLNLLEHIHTRGVRYCRGTRGGILGNIVWRWLQRQCTFSEKGLRLTYAMLTGKCLHR